MSNKIFQSVVYQMRGAIGSTAGVVDESGVVVACTEQSRIGEAMDIPEVGAGGEAQTKAGNTFCWFSSGTRVGYAAFVESEGEAAGNYAAILAVSLQNILQYHDEKFDKSNFIKNVVLENILPGDIYTKARELHFATDAMRVVLLIRTNGTADVSVFDVVSGLFPDKQKDFVFNMNESDTVLVKEIQRGIDEKDVEKLATSIADTLSGEHYVKVTIGIGTPIGSVKELSTSFKEAQIALEGSRVFDTEQAVVSYNHLGIARLIYQLPTTLCEMFLKEVSNQGSIDSLDDETLFTIRRFFENNLNVSETSRGLFVHRNTLVYRLEKIKKLTGLDLREFDDAIIFKVALMVKKYLNSSSSKY